MYARDFLQPAYEVKDFNMYQRTVFFRSQLELLLLQTAVGVNSDTQISLFGPY